MYVCVGSSTYMSMYRDISELNHRTATVFDPYTLDGVKWQSSSCAIANETTVSGTRNMSKFDRVDWNSMMSGDSDSEDGLGVGGSESENDCVSNVKLTVQHPPSPPHRPADGDDMEARSYESEAMEVEEEQVVVIPSKNGVDEYDDILDLHCTEACDLETYQRGGSVDVGVGGPSVAHKPKRSVTVLRSTVGKSFTHHHQRDTPDQVRRRRVVGGPYERPRRPRRQRRQRKDGPDVVDPSLHLDRALYHRSTVTAGERSWTVRTVRSGYEDVVYSVCNCNETPNVVFAALCYLQHDVYTMVLRNCDGKRRYWYDKITRRTEVADGARVNDFERAMRWRASAVGRPSCSPGYDLSAFVLQNVTTDKRYKGWSSSSVNSDPIILVTTDRMLADPAMYRQLLWTPQHRGIAQRWKERAAAGRCNVCRAPAGIVTSDSASVPTLTCWQHSLTYMATASADQTRISNALVVDLQFTRDDDAPEGEFVCCLRLLNARTTKGGGEDITIAELVSSSSYGSIPTTEGPAADLSTANVGSVDLDTAHEVCCSDNHYNDEDLFPSMPVSSAGGSSCVRYYDTTIGRVVDRVHCIASTFQR